MKNKTHNHTCFLLFLTVLLQTDGSYGTVEGIQMAIDKNRIIDMTADKKMREALTVIAHYVKVGNVTEASLNESLTQFRKEIKEFKHKICYQVSHDTASDMDLLMPQCVVDD